MMKNSAAAMSGVAAMNTRESVGLSITAITTEPMMMKGARTTSLISIATATCNWLMSPERRVSREGVLKSSNCAEESVLMCLNRALRTSVP